MTILKSALVKGVFAAAIIGGSLAATAASADVACNRMGECWHVHDRYTYPPGVNMTWHQDNWATSHRTHYHWRADRTDRGYYRNGLWITF